MLIVDVSAWDCQFRALTNIVILLLMAEILHQMIGSLSHYLQGFIHPRWCRISAINSSRSCFCAFVLYTRSMRILNLSHISQPVGCVVLPRVLNTFF